MKNSKETPNYIPHEEFEGIDVDELIPDMDNGKVNDIFQNYLKIHLKTLFFLALCWLGKYDALIRVHRAPYLNPNYTYILLGNFWYL